MKLEKIAALSNNIAAALKAERINILAARSGKSSVGVEVPNAIKTKVIMRDLFESDEWRNTKARIPIALGKDVTAIPSSPTSRKCRTASSPAARVPANPFASIPSSRRCSTASRRINCAS